MSTRVIITGSRGIDRQVADDLVPVAMEEVEDACGSILSVLVSGPSPVAEAATDWAHTHGVAVESASDVAQTRTAPTQNELLLSRADVLVAVWDGACPSTRLLKRQAEEHGLLIAEILLTPRPRRSAPVGDDRGHRPHAR